MPLSKLFDTSEDEWFTILDKFLQEDVVEAMLLAEKESYIEITEEIIDEIADTIHTPVSYTHLTLPTKRIV